MESLLPQQPQQENTPQPQPAAVSSSKLANISRLLPRLIIAVLAIGVLIQLGLSVKTLLQPVPVSKSAKIVPIQGGTLLLLSLKDQYQVGEKVPVLVRVDSGGRTVDGVDALIQYDNKLLFATTSAVVKGKAFSDYPQLSVDQANGLIRISGISGVSNSGFSGIDELATINFLTVGKGQATASFDFIAKGNTNDSNIIEAGTPDDVLGKVVNLKVTIK